MRSSSTIAVEELFAFGLRVDLPAASFSSKSIWTAAINGSRLVTVSIEAMMLAIDPCTCNVAG
ncbi:hypothetical protein B5P46_26810 [Rhizobium leguminosarum]|uniref:Uncharacterized protein n=1 Tax=Rhizobium leguminosarum TaxID=384 RepID=A0A4Q1TJE4_RHILE|nr:hypothetical protein B5P46_26810 [Rhizobium leguminosarum]